MSLDNLYRQVIMDHYQRPRNRGKIGEEVLSVHLNNPSCGDTITLQLQVEDDMIKDIKFEGEGCSISMASASMMTHAVKGKSKEDAMHMIEVFQRLMLGEAPDSKADLGDIEALSGVAKFPARISCATLSWKALEQGVKEAQK